VGNTPPLASGIWCGRRGHTEERVDQHRQCRVGDVGRKLRVALRLAAVELVLVVDPDHELVHERVAETGDLAPRLAVAIAVLVLAEDALAGRGPRADHRIAAGSQAGDRHFDRQARHVLVGEHVLASVHGAQRVQVDQIEGFRQVHHEAFATLTREHPAIATARNRDVVDVLVGVLRVVRDRLVADAIGGLAERAAVRRGVAQERARIATPRAADHRHLIGFDRVQIGVVAGVRSDRADVDEGNRDAASARVDGEVSIRGLEPELEGDVLLGVAVVVDVDLVESVRVHPEEVGSAVGVLQRNVVGDQGHVPFASRLVAPECVEVGAIQLRPPGDPRRLAVARPERRDPGGDHERRTGQQLNRQSFHCVLQKGPRCVLVWAAVCATDALRFRILVFRWRWWRVGRVRRVRRVRRAIQSGYLPVPPGLPVPPVRDGANDHASR